ncbi:MAG: 30S ribosomal protein S18 [Labilithrix sp.]|nr:30S ribosomal protein S18 [Labilithrix sp.]MCW5831205.1 30S ribosomal protein S18 [Labilithrix sp.]
MIDDKQIDPQRKEDEFGTGGIVNAELDRGPKARKRLANRLGLSGSYRFDYKDVQTLRHFITERGKLVPRRISGLSARQQRDLATAVKRARNIALLPFTVSNT